MHRTNSAENMLTRFRHLVSRIPDRPALQTGEQVITFAELEEQSECLAYALLDVGVAPGERIALLLSNSAAFILAYLSILKTGAAVVPINPIAPLPAILGILEDCTPTALFLESRHLSFLTALRSKVSTLRLAYLVGSRNTPEEPGSIRVQKMESLLRFQRKREPLDLPGNDLLAAIVYTSGTTGLPKGVMLSHANFAAIERAGQSLLDLSASDRIGIVTPLFHLYGLREIGTALGVGATVVLPFDMTYPARVLEQFHAAQITGFSAVPSGLTLVVDRYRSQLAACAPHLRYITTGTALASPSLLTTVHDLLPTTRLIVTYGLTEASRVCWREVIPPEPETMVGAVGQPYPGVEVWLVDEVNGIGRVAVRSALVMQGYWNRPEATRAVLTAEGDLLTPDYGRFAPDGTLFLLGRMDEVINCGGEKVSPEEVESVLLQHPSVTAVAVVGAPDPTGVLGEVVRAFVVCSPGASVSVQALKEHAAARLESYKVPRWIEFVERLPRATLGKLQRIRLRKGE